MLTIGDKFPQFDVPATVSTESLEKAFQNIDNNTYKGKWLCVFFYPKDFTFVCPTEIKGFSTSTSSLPIATARCWPPAPTASSCTWPGARITKTCTT